MGFIRRHKVLCAVIVGLLVLSLLIRGINGRIQQKRLDEERLAQEELESQLSQYSGDEDDGGSTVPDSILMEMQPDLVRAYGKLPEGYIWDDDGTLLSLGDKDMTAEEVVYSYLNGLKTLDLSTAQKYSRNSLVIDTYDGYFDETDKSADYTDAFLRNMYRESLLSFQVDGIINSTIFAENKQVFTVRVKMLDLTQKDFWLDDKESIYKNLRLYAADELDSTKADMYLYDYILRYYSSDDAALRDVSFDLTVQRYPDLDTGWLVSIDTDVDSACRYADGNLVVSYINDMFMREGEKYLEELESVMSEEGQ